ncbi:MAG: flagellin [candidate division Zixibacteria bacterium]|nr:flagellin [candidate division Zixibacteria bacterium]
MGFGITGDRHGQYISLFANRHLWHMYNSLGRLSSGLRLNSAADGPAQLVISERLRTQIGSLTQEIENRSALIGKYQSASSTLQELRSQLTDLRSLAVSAANEGGNDESAQAAYGTVGDLIVGSYNRTIETAEYNGSNLVDGSEGAVATVSELEGIDLSSAESAQASIALIDEAIDGLDEQIIEVGATQKNDIESHLASLRISRQNLIAAESQIRDTDYALEFSNFVRESLQARASLAMMVHNRVNAEIILGLLRS